MKRSGSTANKKFLEWTEVSRKRKKVSRILKRFLKRRIKFLECKKKFPEGGKKVFDLTSITKENLDYL